MTASSFTPRDLTASTFVRQVEYHPELASTNDLALEILQSGAGYSAPLLVLCDQQTAGRGRNTNTWWTQPGGLTFSLVLNAEDCGLSAELRPRVSLAAAVAVALTVEDCIGQPAAIKWPNDVFVSQRKIAGILTETAAGNPDVLVVGIGLNVNNTFHAAPVDVTGHAISLFEITTESFALQAVLVSLLRFFETALEQLAGDPPMLAAAWQSRDFLQHKTVTVDSGPQAVSGLCAGIDIDGGLKLHVNGTERKVYGGRVQAYR